ncbi:MAG: fimbria/pilus periplasmic chaperone [Pseudomonadota bacterium]|nr:fimbria/pilus periplasmic chaperone [Pseudomonadota bacterium]
MATVLPARAALQVSPVIVEMAGETRATTLVVENRGSGKTTIQVRAFDWSQDNGEEALFPSQVLHVSPPIFTLTPGKRQVVRLVADRPAPFVGESSFRLFVDELPLEQEGTTIRLPVRFILPVFVGTPAEASDELKWSVRKTAPASVRIEARNIGGRRARLTDIQLRDAGGRKLGEISGLAGYVLAGRSLAWDIGIPPERATGDVRITAMNGQDSLDVRVPLHVIP